MNDAPVLLFDGECAFCNGCVRWLLSHERRSRYCFAALQSDAAKPLLQTHGIAEDDLSSIVLIDQGKLYLKSSAALHLLHEARWPWRLLRIFILVPRGLRDAVYDFVGRRRYRWWGKTQSCIVAEPELRARALENNPHR